MKPNGVSLLAGATSQPYGQLGLTGSESCEDDVLLSVHKNPLKPGFRSRLLRRSAAVISCRSHQGFLPQENVPPTTASSVLFRPSAEPPVPRAAGRTCNPTPCSQASLRSGSHSRNKGILSRFARMEIHAATSGFMACCHPRVDRESLSRRH